MQGWLRGVASGLLVAAIFLILYSLIWIEDVDETVSDSGDQPSLSLKEMRDRLENEGYAVIEHEELNNLQEAKTAEKEETSEQEEAIYRYHLIVESGMSSSDITQRLHQADIVDDQNALQSLIAEKEADGAIQTGTYEFESTMEKDEIVEHLLGHE
ncbi:endolytic transglycosylase MltG [Salsuginibacillus kocurii]|uniref:endolytic transglycosylase MltG n=1 Tax=Salsuginibacillus kocurii TaxID=427078 RepID=UPI0003793F1A|nr:endolytic transglycosylase MltG [Salsuginibacillus kocurii]